MSQSIDNNNINEYRRLNYEARLRDREEEYQKRIRTMNLLMDAAVKQQQQIDNNNNNDNGKRQKSIGRIGVLVQNPYAYLTQAQMDKIRNIVEEIHVKDERLRIKRLPLLTRSTHLQEHLLPWHNLKTFQ